LLLLVLFYQAIVDAFFAASKKGDEYAHLSNRTSFNKLSAVDVDKNVLASSRSREDFRTLFHKTIAKYDNLYSFSYRVGNRLYDNNIDNHAKTQKNLFEKCVPPQLVAPYSLCQHVIVKEDLELISQFYGLNDSDVRSLQFKFWESPPFTMTEPNFVKHLILKPAVDIASMVCQHLEISSDRRKDVSAYVRRHAIMAILDFLIYYGQYPSQFGVNHQPKSNTPKEIPRKNGCCSIYRFLYWKQDSSITDPLARHQNASKHYMAWVLVFLPTVVHKTLVQHEKDKATHKQNCARPVGTKTSKTHTYVSTLFLELRLYGSEITPTVVISSFLVFVTCLIPLCLCSGLSVCF